MYCLSLFLGHREREHGRFIVTGNAKVDYNVRSSLK